MAAITTATVIAGVSAAAGLAGTAVQYAGQRKQERAQKRQERIRRKQADIEAARKRKQVIREAAIARAATTAQVGAQGIGFGGSSLPGAVAGQSQVANANLQGINQGQELGGQMFDAKAEEASGRGISSLGGGISSLGRATIRGYNYFNKG